MVIKIGVGIGGVGVEGCCEARGFPDPVFDFMERHVYKWVEPLRLGVCSGAWLVCAFGGVVGTGGVFWLAGCYGECAVVAVVAGAGGADSRVFPVVFSIWGMGDRRGRIWCGYHRCLGGRALCRW